VKLRISFRSTYLPSEAVQCLEISTGCSLHTILVQVLWLLCQIKDHIRYKIKNNLVQQTSHGKSEIFHPGLFELVKSIVIGHFEKGIPRFAEVVSIMKELTKTLIEANSTNFETYDISERWVFDLCLFQLLWTTNHLRLYLLLKPSTYNTTYKLFNEPTRRFNIVSFWFGSCASWVYRQLYSPHYQIIYVCTYYLNLLLITLLINSSMNQLVGLTLSLFWVGSSSWV